MTELDDPKLLSVFARENSQEAFAILVNRHLNLVYSVGLRLTRNQHAAEEITQAVFVLLAEKARKIGPRVVLSGWLYQTARLTALNYTRGEQRRTHREQEALMQSQVEQSDSDDRWHSIAPWLDETMNRLGERDRTALLLRFFENKSMAEVGQALNASEDAAKMRVNRALEKLRKLFVKRGVALSTTVLATVLSTHSTSAAPVGLATSAAMAGAQGAGFSGSVCSLAHATKKTMAWLKIKIAAGVGAGSLGVVAVGFMLVSGGSEPPADPAVVRDVLTGAFARISAPLPSQMHFVAEVIVENKPVSEKEIRDEVRRQEESLGENDPKKREWIKRMPLDGQAKQARAEAELREIRAETFRMAHGTRVFLKEEWFANGSWRSDSTEKTAKSDALRKLDQPLAEGVEHENTYIQLPAINSNGWSCAHFYHRMRWAHYDNSKWKKDAFWRAATLEPHFAFALLFVAGDFIKAAQLIQTKPASEKEIDSFSGVELDAGKLEALATGKDSRWTVTTAQTNMNNRAMVILRLKGNSISLARGQEIVFFADAANRTNVYRIELTGLPKVDSPYISVRDDFDINGFPHTWIVETPTAEATRTTVRFKKVDWDAEFDSSVVFDTEVPVGYKSRVSPGQVMSGCGNLRLCIDRCCAGVVSLN